MVDCGPSSGRTYLSQVRYDSYQLRRVDSYESGTNPFLSDGNQESLGLGGVVREHDDLFLKQCLETASHGSVL